MQMLVPIIATVLSASSPTASVELAMVQSSVPYAQSPTLTDFWNGSAYWKQDPANSIWPATRDGARQQHMFLNGPEIWMYYDDITTYAPHIVTARARSSDKGLTWTPDGVVLNTGSTWDSSWADAPYVWREGSTYYMVYEATDGHSGWYIGYATSIDGLHWTRGSTSPILSANPSGWEAGGVGTPSVSKIGSQYYMYYHGYDWTDVRIGLATSTSISSGWSKVGLTTAPPGYTGAAPYPLLSTVGNTWEAGTVGARSTLMHEGNYYYLAYEGSTDAPSAGFSASNWSSGFARSQDAIHFTKFNIGNIPLWDKNPVIETSFGTYGDFNPEIIFLAPDWYMFVAMPGGALKRFRLTWRGSSTVASFPGNGSAYSGLHQTGYSVTDGWRTDIYQPANSYLAFGPYYTGLPSGRFTAAFWLRIDNNSADNWNVASIDVRDASSGAVLGSRELYRMDWSAAQTYQPFGITFDNVAGHQMEFRVYYHGGTMLDLGHTDILQ